MNEFAPKYKVTLYMRNVADVHLYTMNLRDAKRQIIAHIRKVSAPAIACIQVNLYAEPNKGINLIVLLGCTTKGLCAEVHRLHANSLSCPYNYQSLLS